MRIHIFRHGEALAKDDPSVPSDPDRPLIEEGIRRTRQSAQGLRQMGVQPDAIFTSPWVRAKQTAQILSDVLRMTDLQDMQELAGDRSVADVMAALAKLTGPEEIILVGHQPLLGEIAAHLLSLSTGMQVDLKKSGVCTIEVERVPPKNPGDTSLDDDRETIARDAVTQRMALVEIRIEAPALHLTPVSIWILPF